MFDIAFLFGLDIDSSKLYQVLSKMNNKEQPGGLQCVSCELCAQTKVLCYTDRCEHEKNGYCALYRLQAAQDIKDVHAEIKEQNDHRTAY